MESTVNDPVDGRNILCIRKNKTHYYEICSFFLMKDLTIFFPCDKMRASWERATDEMFYSAHISFFFYMNKAMEH